MQITAIPDPRNWERWDEAEALLEPARARGDFASVLDDDEALFVAIDDGELLAAITAWLSTEGYAEVKLIGGRDHHRWLAQMDDMIGRLAREAGAERLIGIGRVGWAKSLKRMGWERIGAVDDHWLFERKLKD